MGSDWVRERIGIKVEWLLFPTGPEMVKAFARGELDIGYMGLPPAMIGIDKGLQIKCVAGGHIEGTVLIAKKVFKTLTELGSIKETLSQFKGKAIGTPSKGCIHDVIIRILIDEAGLQQDIAVKNFEWADFILESMEDCVVDGAAGTPPLAVLASRFLDAKIVLPAHVMWPNNPSYGIVTTMDMIKSSPDMLEEFLKLHEEACNLVRSRPEEAAEIVAKTMGVVDKDFVLETYRVSPKYCASLSKEYIDSTMAFVSVLQKMGYISRPLVKDDVFYTRLIERIHPERSHYDDPGMLG
jgi:NitT/TauT family transport system substrate-binding protein